MKQIKLEINIEACHYDELTEKDRKLIDAACEATKRSYAPYSHFAVGAAALLENDIVITGTNQENAAYPSGLCAERTTLFYANSQYPDSGVSMMAIAAFSNGKFLSEPITPCGACRQVLLETENRYGKDIEIILYGTEKTYILENVKQLLPLSFTKGSLRK